MKKTFKIEQNKINKAVLELIHNLEKKENPKISNQIFQWIGIFVLIVLSGITIYFLLPLKQSTHQPPKIIHIRGKVVNNQNSPIPNCQILINNDVVEKKITNEQGQFLIVLNQDSVHEIRIEVSHKQYKSKTTILKIPFSNRKDSLFLGEIILAKKQNPIAKRTIEALDIVQESLPKAKEKVIPTIIKDSLKVENPPKPTFLALQGRVTTPNQKSLEAVKVVSVRGESTLTDLEGFYKLKISDAQKGEQIELTFFKKGYQPYRTFFKIPKYNANIILKLK